MFVVVAFTDVVGKRAVERIAECSRKISVMVRNYSIRRRSAGRKEFGEGIRGMKKKCRKEGRNLVKTSASRFEIGVQGRRSAGRNKFGEGIRGI
jgi:hypothetical protein